MTWEHPEMETEGNSTVKRIALILCTAVLTSTSLAQAATSAFDASFGPVPVVTTPTVLVNLPQFDPALGTLTKVTLSLDADAFAGSIDWDNEAPFPTDLTLGIGAQVTASWPSAVSLVAVPLQLDSAFGVAADNDAGADFVGSDAFSVDVSIGSDSDSDTLTTGLAPYIGVGSFGVTIEAVVQNLISTTGGFGAFQQTPGSTDGLVTVTYEYTPTPAPAVPSLSPVGMTLLWGLLGSAGWRRLRPR
jgi:hypothetical protein